MYKEIKPIDLDELLNFCYTKLVNSKIDFNETLEVEILSIYKSEFKSNPMIDYRKYLDVKDFEIIKFYNRKIIVADYNCAEWKSKRLEVFKRDDFKCTNCGKDSDLQCHHTYYQNGRETWDYPLNSLQTLCRTCHEDFHIHTKSTDMWIDGLYIK